MACVVTAVRLGRAAIAATLRDAIAATATLRDAIRHLLVVVAQSIPSYTMTLFKALEQVVAWNSAMGCSDTPDPPWGVVGISTRSSEQQSRCGGKTAAEMLRASLSMANSKHLWSKGEETPREGGG
jgi:hypothetical protein